MRYGSVCSGIEAASIAWAPLGFVPAWYAEIATFPSAVLSHRHPGVPNHGSLVGLADRLAGDARDIDLLVGGTPCQSFSVAGLRGGLADERGNLALEFARLAQALRPRWIVWENVPGVLSSDGGRAFGSIIGALVELGYGLAWRVLDAQFVRVDGYGRAVPQRRERVFVVGHLGDAARAGAVLLEPEGVRGNPPPRRSAREEVAGPLGGGAPGRGWCDDTDRATFVPEVAGTLNANGKASGSATQQDAEAGLILPSVSPTLDTGHGMKRADQRAYVAEAYQCHGGHVGPAGTLKGRNVTQGIPFFAEEVARALTTRATRIDGESETFLAFDETQVTSPGNRSSCRGDTTALAKSARPPAIAFNARQDPLTYPGVLGPLDTGGSTYGVAHALRAEGFDASEDGTGRGTPLVDIGWRVRRLTPRECERLQGFPDDYTLVPVKTTKRGVVQMAKDSARYAALGNSMACNVMRWLGWRIALVDQLGGAA